MIICVYFLLFQLLFVIIFPLFVTSYQSNFNAFPYYDSVNGSHYYYLNYSDFKNYDKDKIPLQIVNFTKQQLRALVRLLNQRTETKLENELTKRFQEIPFNLHRIKKNDDGKINEFNIHENFLKSGAYSDTDLKNVNFAKNEPYLVSFDENNYNDMGFRSNQNKKSVLSHTTAKENVTYETENFFIPQYYTHISNSTENCKEYLLNLSKRDSHDVSLSREDENSFNSLLGSDFEYEIPSVAVIGDGKKEIKVNLITPRPIIVKKDLTDSNSHNFFHFLDDKFPKRKDFGFLNDTAVNVNNNHSFSSNFSGYREMTQANNLSFPISNNRFSNLIVPNYISQAKNSLISFNEEKDKISFNLELKAKLPIHSSPLKSKNSTDVEYNSEELRLGNLLHINGDDNYSLKGELISSSPKKNFSLQKRQNTGKETDKLSDIKLKISFEAVMPEDDQNKQNEQARIIDLSGDRDMISKKTDVIGRKVEDSTVKYLKMPANVLTKRAAGKDNSDMTFCIHLEAKIPQKFVSSDKNCIGETGLNDNNILLPRNNLNNSSFDLSIPTLGDSYKQNNSSFNDNEDQEKNMIEVVVVKNNINESDIHNNAMDLKLTGNGHLLKNPRYFQNINSRYSNTNRINVPQRYDSSGKNIFRIKFHPNVTGNSYDSKQFDSFSNLSMENEGKQIFNYSDRPQDRLLSDLLKSIIGADKKIDSNQNSPVRPSSLFDSASSTSDPHSNENVLTEIRTLNNTLTKLVNELKLESPSFHINGMKQTATKKEYKGNHHSIPFSPIFQQLGLRFANANDSSELILKE